MTLYNFALKQSSALIFAQGIYLSEYYLRCKYGCNRSLHFGAVGVQRTFPYGPMQNCRPIFSIPKSFESLQNIYMCRHE